MTEPLLAITDLAVDYRSGRRDWTPAVDGVSVSIAPGEFVSLVGESGCGKSTLIQGTLGLLPASARIRGGTISYSGVDVTNWSDQRMTRVRGNYVGFVPQDPGTALNPTKKIGRQVVEAVRFNSPGRGEAARDEALDYLRTAGLKNVERLFEQYPHELSGGMKQRALIAIALAGKPKLILADEPTSGLDVTVQRVILDHLSELGRSLDLGVLLVTHDLGVALDRSDRILVMREGEIVEEGTAQELVDRPLRSEYARRLLAAAHRPGRLRPRKLSSAVIGRAAVSEEVVRPVAIEDKVGSEAAIEDKVGSEVAIEGRGLSKHYTVRAGGGAHVVRALDGVSIAVRTGTTHAVVGESGAGKSTLAGILAGFVAADAGVVKVGDDELTGLSRGGLRELRRRLQFVFQNPFTSLDPRFTVNRIVAEPLRAFRLASIQTRVRELLHAVSLDDEYLDRLPEQLSGGQRQRVAIARALALNPEILVLDEAVSALDVSVQAQILQLLVDLQAEFRLSYVFVTHDLGVVQQIADDVTVMKDGVVVESGPTDQVLRSPAHEYTRELLAAIPGERRHDVPTEQSA
ncbi:dipeptide ABC transporter ATP-binding protein [Kribbella sp. NPDC055110]